MENNQKVELKIETYLFDGLKAKRQMVTIPDTQEVVFMYDKFIKGRRVAMILISKEGINEPNKEIYFTNKDLKKILEFLIDSEK